MCVILGWVGGGECVEGSCGATLSGRVHKTPSSMDVSICGLMGSRAPSSSNCDMVSVESSLNFEGMLKFTALGHVNL